MEYTPDKWIVIRMTKGNDACNRVLSGFSGGYLSGDSWRINSGNVEEIEEEDRYIFIGNSGSKTICYKNRYGTNMISTSILNQLIEQSDESDATIEVLKQYDPNSQKG